MISTTRVRSDDKERDVVRVVILRDSQVSDQVEPEATADGSIQEPETVLPRLDIQKWPRLTISRRHCELYTFQIPMRNLHVNDISEEVFNITSRGNQFSICLVLFGG